MSIKKQLSILLILPGGSLGLPAITSTVEGLARCHDVHVIFMYKTGDDYVNSNYKIHYVNANNKKVNVIKIVRTFLLFLKIHREVKIDILHGIWIFPQGFLAVMIARLFGLKSMVHIRGSGSIDIQVLKSRGIRSTHRKMLNYLTIKLASATIAECHYNVALMQQRGLRPLIKVVYTGVKPALLRAKETLNKPCPIHSHFKTKSNKG